MEQIRAWIAEHAGRETADHSVDALLTRCESLLIFPHRGTPRDDLRPGMRTIPHRRRFTIGYRVIDDQVIILGICSAGQMLDATLGDGS